MVNVGAAVVKMRKILVKIPDAVVNIPCAPVKILRAMVMIRRAAAESLYTGQDALHTGQDALRICRARPRIGQDTSRSDHSFKCENSKTNSRGLGTLRVGMRARYSLPDPLFPPHHR